MPYPSEHAARIISPSRFEEGSFRRKNIAPGIDIILGKLKGETEMTAQAYRFKKDKFTEEEARVWLKDHKINPISFEPAVKLTQAFVDLQAVKIKAFKDYLHLILPEKMAEIKEKDSHPFFQVYSICHEGVSSPRIIGDAARPIEWTRRAIQSLKNIIMRGVKFFKGHNDDSSTIGRRQLGEIVGDGQEEIKGKLHHIVVGYFSKENREEAKTLDVCSQEAEWNFFEKAGKWIADKIETLTGIALGESGKDEPAFRDAGRLSMVQAFNTQAESQKREEKTMPEKLSFSELKTQIREMNVHPSQLYSFDELKKDKEYDREFKVFDELQESLKKSEAKILTLEDEKKNLAKQTLQSTAKMRLQKIVSNPDLKLTEKQKKFVDVNFEDGMEDLSDEALSKFVNKQLDVYKKSASLFGDEKTTTTESVESKKKEQENIDPSDLTKAANNEFLKTDMMEV
jgi:hypothetical protein